MILSQKRIEKFNLIIKSFAISTDICCKILNLEGETILSLGCADNNSLNTASFCKFIQNIEDGKKRCFNSYLNAGKVAEKIGEPYIYSCPYGLINWIVPIFKNDETQFYFSAGPVLIHQLDDFLMTHILNLHPALKNKKAEIQDKLNRVPIVNTTRVRYLALLLFKLAKIFMAEDVANLNNRKEINIFNAHLVENINEIKRTGKFEGVKDNTSSRKREEDLLAKVKSGDKEGAKEILNQFLGQVFYYSADKIEVIKFEVIRLIILVAREISEFGVDYNLVSEIKNKYVRTVLKTNNFNNITKNIYEALDYFIDLTKPVLNVKNRNTILIATNYARNHYSEDITLESVSKQVGMHPVNFSKIFKKETGKSYIDFVNEVRVEAGKRMLEKGDLPLAQIAMAVGFNDQSYFSKIFKKFAGVSPKKWRTLQNE